MEDKALKIIQLFSLIAWILCRVVYISCLVLGIFYAGGIVSNLLVKESISLLGVSVRSLAAASERFTTENLALNLAVCAAECVVSGFAGKYFRNEQKAGTPFTREGARELLRCGDIVASVSAWSGILCCVAEIVFRLESRFGFFVGNVAAGVFMATAAMLCFLGVDKQEKNGEKTKC